jgi:hypothetical protein
VAEKPLAETFGEE